MTYVAGQEGDVTVVWIAERFREEHRAAIDWLNASTLESFNFFAVEIELLKIGNSAPAPRFNVVGKPNEWSRGIARATQRVSDASSNERQRFYIEYWSQFASYLADQRSPFQFKGTFKDYWCGIRFGVSGVQFAATAHRKGLGVELYISRDDGKATFRGLEVQKADIERTFGEPLDWQEMPDKTASRIAIHRAGNPADERDRSEQFRWFATKLERFRAAVVDRVRALIADADADGNVINQRGASN